MKKLIINGKQITEESKCIRVSGEAAAILDDLSMKTDRSISFLASEMIKFAAEHVEIQTVAVRFKGTK